jgi:hypothetical protein
MPAMLPCSNLLLTLLNFNLQDVRKLYSRQYRDWSGLLTRHEDYSVARVGLVRLQQQLYVHDAASALLLRCFGHYRLRFSSHAASVHSCSTQYVPGISCIDLHAVAAALFIKCTCAKMHGFVLSVCAGVQDVITAHALHV